MRERKFIERGIRDLQISEYLKSYLDRADYSHIEIRRTPLNTRIVIYAAKPGIIIGHAGANIKALTEILKEKFKIENPQLEIKTIDKPSLDATIIAKQIAIALEKGMKYRMIGNTYLRHIMEAGAVGAEIVIVGKLSGERSRSERFVEGYIKKCGETADRYVEKAQANATLKVGVLGICVRIMKTLPSMMLLEREIKKEEPTIEEKPEEAPKEEKKKPKKKAVKKKEKKVVKKKEKPKKTAAKKKTTKKGK